MTCHAACDFLLDHSAFSSWGVQSCPAALVRPKTRDTVAEGTCNIDRHLSIDLIYHKRGIFRQSWSRHVREPPTLFKCEVRSLFFLLSKRFLDATCRAQPRAGWKCIWERLDWNRITHCMFTSTAEQRNTQAVLKRTCQTGITLAYDSYPSSIGLPLAEDTCNISSNLSIDLTYRKCGVFSLEADIPENHLTSSSVKWDVLLSLCAILSWMQQRASRKCFMGKAALKPDHKLHVYKHVLANIHESPWHMIPICPKTCDTVRRCL